MTNKYKIETIEDFLKVPEDRLNDCLEDFKTFIEMIRFMKEVGNGVEMINHFVWIDDNKKDHNMNIQDET